MISDRVKNKGISLVNIKSKQLHGIVLREISSTGQRRTCDIELGFGTDRYGLHKMFILCEILEYRHTVNLSATSFFLDPKAVFYSVSQALPWSSFSLMNVLRKVALCSKFLSENNRGRLQTNYNISPEFTTKTDVRQRPCISLLILKFKSEFFTEINLSSRESSGM